MNELIYINMLIEKTTQILFKWSMCHLASIMLMFNMFHKKKRIHSRSQRISFLLITAYFHLRFFLISNIFEIVKLWLSENLRTFKDQRQEHIF